jgi:hypothetical protein
VKICELQDKVLYQVRVGQDNANGVTWSSWAERTINILRSERSLKKGKKILYSGVRLLSPRMLNGGAWRPDRDYRLPDALHPWGIFEHENEDGRALLEIKGLKPGWRDVDAIDHLRYGDGTCTLWLINPKRFHRDTVRFNKRLMTFVRDFELQLLIMYVGAYPVPENAIDVMFMQGDFEGECPGTGEPWTLADIQQAPRWTLRETQLYFQVYGHTRSGDELQFSSPKAQRPVHVNGKSSPRAQGMPWSAKKPVLVTIIDDKLGEL